MLIKGTLNGLWRVFEFYKQGFSSMTLGKTLWGLIVIKLFIMFFVLKIFVFDENLNSKFPNASQKSEFVLENLINPTNSQADTTKDKAKSQLILEQHQHNLQTNSAQNQAHLSASSATNQTTFAPNSANANAANNQLNLSANSNENSLILHTNSLNSSVHSANSAILQRQNSQEIQALSTKSLTKEKATKLQQNDINSNTISTFSKQNQLSKGTQ